MVVTYKGKVVTVLNYVPPLKTYGEWR